MEQTFVISHPYYPRHADLASYEPNTTPVGILLIAFGSILAIVLTSTLKLATRANAALSGPDKLLFSWFVLCGSIHCFFEGCFIINHAHLAGSQGLFAQLWKEYALSDSRYLTSDPFMLSVETITVLAWGPLCYVTAVCIVEASSVRYPLQIIVCVAHLYGVALYYATCFAEGYYHGISHSRPEFLYFWVYFVGFNLPWVVVPLVILVNSVVTIRRVFLLIDMMEVTLASITEKRSAQKQEQEQEQEPKKTR